MPKLGIQPGIEVYNQLFEYYARNYDYKKTRDLLHMLAATNPTVRLDALSYSYIIQCCANAKKPHDALRYYEQMRDKHIAPNSHAYMGVLKALTDLRDGYSAVQVWAKLLQYTVYAADRVCTLEFFSYLFAIGTCLLCSRK